MHLHQHLVHALDRALDQGHVLLTVQQRLIGVAGEVAPAGRDGGLGDPADELLVLAAVADQVGDGQDRQLVLDREALQVRHPGHGAVLVDDLAQHPGRVAPGHAGQVDGCLGVAGALEHAALAVAQREDVAGLARSAGRVAGSIRVAMVRERSAAEMPVTCQPLCPPRR